MPEKHQSEELRGKPVTFTAKVLRVEEGALPELNDDFAKEKLNATSAQAFKEMVEQSIRSQEEQMEMMRRERAIMEEIGKRTEADIAPEIVDEEMRSLAQEWNATLEQRGMTLEQWLAQQKKEWKEFEKELRTQAEERAKLRFGMAKLVEERKVTLSDDEFKHAMTHFLESVPAEQKADAQKSLQPGTSLYQELQWRATVEKLMKELLA